MRFEDRIEAGRLLAERLQKYRNQPTVVYALPRGGVVMGAEIAQRLGAPLDLVIPRKVGHPSNPEYAVCAITEDGQLFCNQAEADRLGEAWLKQAAAKEQAEARRRRQLYLDGRPPVPVEGKTAIIVDDGVATGLTMLAAIQEVKARRPARIVVAVPVIPADIAAQLAEEVDEIVALDIPEYYRGSVGSYYREFNQVEDEEVIELMDSLADTPARQAASHG
jgi:predicted phosphoribosyltransferase